MKWWVWANVESEDSTATLFTVTMSLGSVVLVFNDYEQASIYLRLAATMVAHPVTTIEYDAQSRDEFIEVLVDSSTLEAVARGESTADVFIEDADSGRVQLIFETDPLFGEVLRLLRAKFG